MDLDNRLVGEVKEAIGEINSDGQKLDLGQWTYNRMCKGCIVELCIWNLYTFDNQYNPNKFSKKGRRILLWSECISLNSYVETLILEDDDIRRWSLWKVMRS